jgi:hypothetical protein
MLCPVLNHVAIKDETKVFSWPTEVASAKSTCYFSISALLDEDG